MIKTAPAGLLCAVLSLALTAAPSRAATITLTALDFGTSTSEYEGDGSFVGFSGSYLAAGFGTGNNLARAIVEFDISSIDVGWTLTSATFLLTDDGFPSGDMSGAGTNAPRWGYAGDGVAQLGDEDTTGATSLATLVTTGTGASTYGVDVLSLITGLVGASEDYAGFIVAEQAFCCGFLNFDIPGSGPTEPRLVIEYDETPPEEPGPAPVPEPTSLLLLTTGGLIGAAVRRRRSGRGATSVSPAARSRS